MTLLIDVLTVLFAVGLVCLALGIAAVVSDLLGVDEWL